MKPLRDRARTGDIVGRKSLLTGPIGTVLLLTLSAVLVVAAAATSSGSPLLFVLAAVAVGLVLHRTATLTPHLHRERRLSMQLDEARAQLILHREELEVQRHELQRLALYDVVTGLGNRALLRNRGTDLGPELSDTTLLLLDLDGFKEVNDTLGHDLGDSLLRQVGDRLMTCVRDQDTVVRLGGDEFAVLLPHMGAWAAARTADRLLDALRRPFLVDRQEVQVRGSVGIAEGGEGRGLDELLRNADLAMYQAKEAGRDRSCEFRSEMVVDTAERVSFGTEMRQALAADHFKVYYQPIVDSRSHEMVSLEALVRWEHPVRGVLPPSDFLPVAYQTGLIVELGQFVLRSACEQTAVWRRKRPGLSVAVNVSHRELLHPEFSSQVAGVLAMTGLEPQALYLEVTETVLAAEEQITEILEPLTDMGVRCSLDDFGTGHSSLSRLRQLSLDRVKIDCSFVAEIADDGSKGAPLLVSIVGLAHSIGLSVVAEGVETKRQADFLAANGCDELQGYYFSRPVSSAVLQSRFLSASPELPRRSDASKPLLRPVTSRS